MNLRDMGDNDINVNKSFLSKNVLELGNKEFFQKYFVYSLIVLFLLFLFLGLSVNCVLCFVGFSLGYFGLYYIVLNKSSLNEKYGLYSKNPYFSISYQAYVLECLLVSPGLIFGVILLGICNGLDFGVLLLLILFVFLVPVLGLFFRINVFNDCSCVCFGGKFNVGYSTMSYGFLLYFVSLISFILVYFISENFAGDLWYFVWFVALLFVLVFQLLLLFPDKLNIVVPVDLRFDKFSLVFLVLIQLLFFVFVNGLANFYILIFNISLVNYGFIVHLQNWFSIFIMASIIVDLLLYFYNTRIRVN